MRFTKMHGLGNDYVYVNCLQEKVDDPISLAPIISDRHFGVGADGLILICPSQVADVRMRMFNADGSEAQMCGNGIRCVAKYVVDHGLSTAKPLSVETGNGVLSINYEADAKGRLTTATVDMGEPVLAPDQIPVRLKGTRIVDHEIDLLSSKMTCVSMGNPHAIFFCDDVNSIDLEKIGPEIENHEIFPERTNVHIVEVNAPDELTMRTWERGTGITLACGTGACGVCVAGVLTARSNRLCKIHLPGGDLDIDWNEQDNHVYMTGPATEVFEGNWPD